MNQDKLSCLNFFSNNPEMLETYTQQFYDTVLEAFLNNDISQLTAEVEDISESYERISNLLEIDNNELLKKAYSFGMLTSLSDLALDIANYKTDESVSRNLINSYKLLMPTLKLLAEKGAVSGKTLQKELNLSSSSCLTNFISRITKYNLIGTTKIGNSNIYSLTSKGEEVLISCEDVGNKTGYSADFAIQLLTDIAKEMTTENPNITELVLKIIKNNSNSYNNKRVLRMKLNSVFCARDEFVRIIILKKIKSGQLFKEENRIPLNTSDYNKQSEHYYYYRKYAY